MKSAPPSLDGRSIASRNFATCFSPASRTSTSVARLPTTLTLFTPQPPLSLETTYPENTNPSVSKLATLRPSRGVAQPGSALRSGRRGPQFKSGHPDVWGLAVGGALLLKARSGRRVKTGARAELARPDDGAASGASAGRRGPQFKSGHPDV